MIWLSTLVLPGAGMLDCWSLFTASVQGLGFRDAQGLSHGSGYVDVHGTQTEG